jgi:hypothetical protein
MNEDKRKEIGTNLFEDGCKKITASLYKIDTKHIHGVPQNCG